MCEPAIARFERQEFLGAVARRVTCAIAPENTAVPFAPEGVAHAHDRSSIAACRDAIAAAAEERSPLLVLFGDIQPVGCRCGTAARGRGQRPDDWFRDRSRSPAATRAAWPVWTRPATGRSTSCRDGSSLKSLRATSSPMRQRDAC